MAVTGMLQGPSDTRLSVTTATSKTFQPAPPPAPPPPIPPRNPVVVSGGAGTGGRAGGGSMAESGADSLANRSRTATQSHPRPRPWHPRPVDLWCPAAAPQDPGSSSVALPTAAQANAATIGD
jgi:hypothetical protein